MSSAPQSASAVELHTDVEPIAADWEALAERAAAPPFLYPEWFRAFDSAFARGRWEIVCLREAGRLVAVLPLRRRHGLLVGAHNWHTPGFGAIAEDDAATAALAMAAVGNLRRRLDVSFLDSDEPLLSALREAARTRGLDAIERVVERSPYVTLSGDWEQFEAGLPGKRRADLRRRRKRLDEQGAVTISPLPADAELRPALQEAFAIEALGWKGRRGTAIVSDPKTLAFYERIASWARERGWLRLWFLRVDERALAFAFCFVQGGAHYVLKVGFDPDHSKFAPGTLLTQRMLAEAFESGLSRYEFLGQPDPYKLVWTDQCHEKRRLQLFPRSPTGLAERAAWQHGRPAVKRALEAIQSRRS